MHYTGRSGQGEHQIPCASAVGSLLQPDRGLLLLERRLAFIEIARLRWLIVLDRAGIQQAAPHHPRRVRQVFIEVSQRLEATDLKIAKSRPQNEV